MRILHVAPVWLPVSEHAHGGIETLLAQLVAAQRDLGHEVTLVAAGDSQVDVRLVPGVPEALVRVMERGDAGDYAYYEQELVGAALRAATEADVVHSHVVPGAFVLDDVLQEKPPVLHTLHGQVTQDLCWSLGHRSRRVVAVSQAQAVAARSAGAELFAVAHNGIDMRDVAPSTAAGNDLLFLGRMEPQKGPDLAILAARATGRRIRLGGPVTDQTFFESVVAPLLGPDAEYVGILGRDEKFTALRSSACLVVPSRWAEPFGMVSVEAMACGTPVAALSRGALPEVIDQDVTGVVVDDESELPKAVDRAAELDRSIVRDTAWSRFHISSVAERYLDLYRELVNGSRP